MNIRKPLFTVLAIIAVVVSYGLLISVFEWLRVKAGVGSDTGTPIDVLAWQGCMFAALVVAGNLAQGLLRSAGVVCTAAMFLGLGICMVMHLNDFGDGSLVFDGFSATFGALTFPVMAWTVLSGLATGWALSTSGHGKWVIWPTFAALTAALIQLVIVFYPADKYFVSIWGR